MSYPSRFEVEDQVTMASPLPASHGRGAQNTGTPA